jgi:hypothetical protein
MGLSSLRVELYLLLEPLIGFGRIDDIAVQEMQEQILRKLKCRESNSFNFCVIRHSATPDGLGLALRRALVQRLPLHQFQDGALSPSAS